MQPWVDLVKDIFMMIGAAYVGWIIVQALFDRRD